jgi:cation diffusion facilitator CzcD-associated flavoprotein CzcO
MNFGTFALPKVRGMNQWRRLLPFYRATIVAQNDEYTVHTSCGHDDIHLANSDTTCGCRVRGQMPRVPGMSDFRGHVFHTSRWDYSYTGGSSDGKLNKLAGKRVAIIGTGATAVQVRFSV